jgi:hypothetical protein
VHQSWSCWFVTGCWLIRIANGVFTLIGNWNCGLSGVEVGWRNADAGRGLALCGVMLVGTVRLDWIALVHHLTEDMITMMKIIVRLIIN